MNWGSRRAAHVSSTRVQRVCEHTFHFITTILHGCRPPASRHHRRPHPRKARPRQSQ
jgi:hypothetical protein